MRTVDFTGTVSQATMRAQDVLPACMDVLAEYHPDKFNEIVYDIAYGLDDRFTQLQASMHYSDILADDDHALWQSEDCSFILNEDIWDAMQEIAPAGYYFGSHPGDGCDYGYWRVDPSETCDQHTWKAAHHPTAGLVWQCTECNCIAESPISQFPCARCGAECGDARQNIVRMWCKYCARRAT